MPFNDTSESQGKRRNRLKIVIILLVVFVLGLGGGVGGWMWYSAKKKRDSEAKENEIETRHTAQLVQKNIKTLLLDPFIVKLQAKDGYLQNRIAITLSTSGSTIEQKLSQSLPVVRERIFSYLANHSSEQFSSVDQKALIGKEVTLLVNSIIEPQLTHIYILQQQPSAAELKNLERIGVLPKQSEQMTQVAREAASQFWRISEMDLPISGVLIKSTFVD